jgi:hypothetical protein
MEWDAGDNSNNTSLVKGWACISGPASTGRDRGSLCEGLDKGLAGLAAGPDAELNGPKGALDEYR